MSTLSPCDLSAEFVLHVFKILDDLFQAIAFNGTSRQYHSIWMDNVTAITNFILPHAIECYDQACERIAAETFFVNNEKPAGGSYPAIEHARRALAKAKIARDVLHRFEESVVEHATGRGVPPSPPTVDPGSA